MTDNRINGHKKNDKNTNNHVQCIAQKTKD